MPYATRARRDGDVGTNTPSRRSESPTSHHSSDAEPNLEDSTEDDEAGEEEDIPTKGKRKRKTVQLPTLHNFHALGLEWGQARADRIIGRLPHIKTRASPTIIFEAQALQAQYNLDKTMLCIAAGISRPTLDAAL